MSGSVVVSGDKLHIITRRLFDEDLRRHFVGEVTAVSDQLCEMQGYLFVFNSGANDYRKRPSMRTRIFSLADSGYIINKIPREVDLNSLEYQMVHGRLVVTDKKAFSLDINEFGPAS